MPGCPRHTDTDRMLFDLLWQVAGLLQRCVAATLPPENDDQHYMYW